MSWEEKIVGLEPLAVTAAFFITTALSGLLFGLIPIGSSLTWTAFAISALIVFSTILTWTGSVYAVCRSRLPSFKGAGAPFQSLLFWLAAWCALSATTPYLPSVILYVAGPILTLLTGVFYLRAIWKTMQALESFEKSPSSFWTFIQIAYFPIGIWFLRPRLQRLLAAPRQAVPSPA